MGKMPQGVKCIENHLQLPSIYHLHLDEIILIQSFPIVSSLVQSLSSSLPAVINLAYPFLFQARALLLSFSSYENAMFFFFFRYHFETS